MPLVTSKEILTHARKEGYAVGAFNANNMEQVQGIIEAATEERAPVILQVSQGAIRYAGLEFATAMVRTAAELTDVPVVLHLDHGTDFDQNIKCLHAGFTSLMYDGSAKSYEENVAVTKRVCDVAHICGIPVEAELGKVPKIQDNLTPEQVDDLMAKPELAQDFISRTGADSLAIAIGSVHGMEAQGARLDIERLKRIAALVAVPLVLHGSSGVQEESIQEGIQYGLAKVNVATYLNQAFVNGMKAAVAKLPNETDPRKILAVSRDEVKEAVRGKIRLLGSNGRFSAGGGLVSGPKSYRSADLGAVE
jgi:fructose-bisphosphate aldolase, class II